MTAVVADHLLGNHPSTERIPLTTTGAINDVVPGNHPTGGTDSAITSALAICAPLPESITIPTLQPATTNCGGTGAVIPKKLPHVNDIANMWGNEIVNELHYIAHLWSTMDSYEFRYRNHSGLENHCNGYRKRYATTSSSCGWSICARR